MLPKRITAIRRRLTSLIDGPHCALFIASFIFALLFGLLFVWSIQGIAEGDLILFWIPVLFVLFFREMIVKNPEMILALYYKTLWRLVKTRIKPFRVERLDPNNAHMRPGLIVLMRIGYISGALLSFLNFW